MSHPSKLHRPECPESLPRNFARGEDAEMVCTCGGSWPGGKPGLSTTAVALTAAQRSALEEARRATDEGGVGCMIVPSKRMPRKMADSLYDLGLLESFDTGHTFSRGTSTLRISAAGRAALEGK